MCSIDEVKHALAGFSAGVVGTLLGFPLDSCKVRMQTQPFVYPTLHSTIGRIFREEGLAGFYRGVGPPLTALTFLNSVVFALYERAKVGFGVDELADTNGLRSITPGGFNGKVALAGGIVCLPTAVVSTPFELLKTQMVTRPSPAYSNFLKAGATIFREQGLRFGLYTGHMVNTCREMIFLATYFTTYEHAKANALSSLPTSVAIPLAGGFSGAAGWVISYPLDVVKGNLQSQNLATTPADRLRALVVVKQILQTRGLRGLYSGVAPSILRAFLVSSSRFSAFEATLWLLN